MNLPDRTFVEEWWQTATPSQIKGLLTKGADVNARSEIGWTPLHRAAANNQNSEVIEVLLRAGADVNARDKNGRTPLHGAAEGNQNPEVIEVLVRAGADVNARSETGRTPCTGQPLRTRILS